MIIIRCSRISLYGPTLSWQINHLSISCYKLAYKWVYATLSLNWPGLQTIVKIKSHERTSERASNLNLYFRVFKEYPQKSQISESETNPNLGTWLGIP